MSVVTSVYVCKLVYNTVSIRTLTYQLVITYYYNYESNLRQALELRQVKLKAQYATDSITFETN